MFKALRSDSITLYCTCAEEALPRAASRIRYAILRRDWLNLYDKSRVEVIV